MPAKIIPPNPIRSFLDHLLATGKTSKEKICVACDLKYHTLDNLWQRLIVSKMVRVSLVAGGVISKSLSQEYEQWFVQQYLPSIERKEKSNGRKKRTVDTQNKSHRKAQGASVNGEDARE